MNEEMGICVVCGEAGIYGKRYSLCGKHRKLIYSYGCAECGRTVYRSNGDLGSVKCEECGAGKGRNVRLFLRKGRTEGELKREYGDRWEELVQRDYEGYRLFVQRNEWGERVYALLPEMKEEVEVQEKEWGYYLGKNEKGEPEPYLLVQIPEGAWREGEIVIAPLFDVHLGHFAHRHEKFLSYVEWIRTSPNVFAVIGGDLLENALEGDHGMTYDQSAPPATQMEMALRILGSIAHKILVATSGNHEHRTFKRVGLDPMGILCDRLKIPYFSGPVLMSVCAGEYNWVFWVTHGSGNSQTKGGKLNSAQRPHRFNGMLHFSLSGHVHDPIVNPETVLVQDMVNHCLKKMTRWTVIAQSFLGWYGTYAYRAGWGPPGRGGVACVLKRNGEYKATLE